MVSLLGCSDEDPQGGPGPVGPVGPVGDETGIPGSGTIVAETRDVAAFDRIVFRSEGHVVIAAAGNESLVIETDENLQQYLEASVAGSVLEITTTEGVDIAPSEPPVYRIEMLELAGVELAGAGTVDLGSIETDQFEITLSGVGDISLDSVAVEALVVDLHGVGTVALAGGADRQEAFVGGMTEYHAANLESRSTAIEAAELGEATIWASAELEVTARDSASVRYYGTPAVTEMVSGAASVTPLGVK